MPSLVADVGYIVEEHIGRAKASTFKPSDVEPSSEVEPSGDQFPDYATVCPLCKVKFVVPRDGCPTCLNCGDSKCG